MQEGNDWYPRRVSRICRAVDRGLMLPPRQDDEVRIDAGVPGQAHKPGIPFEDRGLVALPLSDQVADRWKLRSDIGRRVGCESILYPSIDLLIIRTRGEACAQCFQGVPAAEGVEWRGYTAHRENAGHVMRLHAHRVQVAHVSGDEGREQAAGTMAEQIDVGRIPAKDVSALHTSPKAGVRRSGLCPGAMPFASRHVGAGHSVPLQVLQFDGHQSARSLQVSVQVVEAGDL